MATLINQFTWIPIYQELAQVLAGWESRQEELIAFLEELRSEGYVITPLHDRDTDGARFVLREIDPFTFFGVFNRALVSMNLIVFERQNLAVGVVNDPSRH